MYRTSRLHPVAHAATPLPHRNRRDEQANDGTQTDDHPAVPHDRNTSERAPDDFEVVHEGVELGNAGALTGGTATIAQCLHCPHDRRDIKRQLNKRFEKRRNITEAG